MDQAACSGWSSSTAAVVWLLQLWDCKVLGCAAPPTGAGVCCPAHLSAVVCQRADACFLCCLRSCPARVLLCWLWSVLYACWRAAERALDALNYTEVNGKPIRIMWSHRDPAFRKSGVGNIFIKVRRLAATAAAARQLPHGAGTSSSSKGGSSSSKGGSNYSAGGSSIGNGDTSINRDSSGRYSSRDRGRITPGAAAAAAAKHQYVQLPQ